MHAPGTIWRHAVRRVDRRAARLIATRAEADAELLREAVSLSNRIFYMTSECGPRRAFR